MSEETVSEQEYQRRYYQEHRQERTKLLRERWRHDPEYRAREQERAKKRRGELRAQRAAERFEQMIERKQAAGGVTRPPRFVMLRGQPVQVWTSGSLGREVGRSPRAIRGWLRDGVLPGATAYIGEAAFFSRDFCEAVWRACKRIYYLDGRGDKQVLKRIIREELAAGRVSYVPPNGDNEQDRVTATAVAAG
jgi:hypothetical protein